MVALPKKKWKMDGARKAMASAKAERSKRLSGLKDGGLVTFALRITEEERAAIHRAAGKGNASAFARSVLAAAAQANMVSLEEIIKASKAGE